jgi:hypothetical protein
LPGEALRGSAGDKLMQSMRSVVHAVTHLAEISLTPPINGGDNKTVVDYRVGCKPATRARLKGQFAIRESLEHLVTLCCCGGLEHKRCRTLMSWIATIFIGRMPLRFPLSGHA